MKRVIAFAGALGTVASAASGGAIERSTQSVNPLFEQGRYIEFSFSGASPDVSGDGSAAIGGGTSGDMAPSYFQFGAAYKADLNDTWSYAIIFDQPYGADVDYPAGTGYFAQGSVAEFKSHALTGILQYNLPSNVSLYGGVRLQSIEATANIPFIPGGYDVVGEGDYGVGYLVGAAYERPDIALRVSLTYNSAIEHDLNTTENSTALGTNVSGTDVETPQSVNLEFQSGVATDTLVFGSVRWVDWSEFVIAPENYGDITGGPLVSYAGDYTTYTLGVGRRLNDTWSVAATVSYEDSIDAFTTNLGPTDGATSYGVAATYTRDNMKITGGIRYVDVGDADTQAGPVAPAGLFRDNSAWGVGVKVGYTF